MIDFDEICLPDQGECNLQSPDPETINQGYETVLMCLEIIHLLHQALEGACLALMDEIGIPGDPNSLEEHFLRRVREEINDD